MKVSELIARLSQIDNKDLEVRVHNYEDDFSLVLFEVNTDGQTFATLGVEEYDEQAEYEDDGQPDEAQEWHDFDPDC